MSKGLKLGIAVLVLILIAVGGIAGLALMQKQTLEGQLASTQTQYGEAQNKITELTAKLTENQQNIDKLSSDLKSKTREAAQAQSTLSDLQHRVDEAQAQIDQVTGERDDWKSRIETMRRERDELVTKLKEQTEQAVQQAKQAEVAPAVDAPSNPNSAEGEDYWANVVKQKAALQLELDKVKSELDQTALGLTDAKKINSDLQLQLKELKDEKDEIERKIKYGEDLANNLSIELARARNDQKFTNDRADKLKDQNGQLQDQIRQLMTTKVALERTVAHLNDDKSKMQNKLAETENVIQGRINEIWQIKESLDEKISNMPNVPKQDNKSVSVDLPPIVVNTSGADVATESGEGANAPKTEGSVLSINLPNNFVIIDMGQSNSSLRMGNALKVMRDNREIATLEVIQVRRDISAADIKQKSSDIKVGDVVKSYN